MCSICCKPWLLSLAIKFYGGREDFRVTDACALSARQGKSSLALRFCQGRFNPYHEDGMWNLTVSTPNRSNWSTSDIFWHIMSVVKELWVSSSIISIATLSCFCWVENSWSEEISRKNSRRLIAFPVFFSELNILPPVDRLPLVLPSCSRLCDYATWLKPAEKNTSSVGETAAFVQEMVASWSFMFGTPVDRTARDWSKQTTISLPGQSLVTEPATHFCLAGKPQSNVQWQERFRAMTHLYYRDAAGAVLRMHLIWLGEVARLPKSRLD